MYIINGSSSGISGLQLTRFVLTNNSKWASNTSNAGEYYIHGF